MTVQTPITGWLSPEDYARAKAMAAPRHPVREIAKEVADLSGLSANWILSKRKTPRKLIEARWLVWAIAHRAGLSYPEIGRVTGHDHTTVMHGVQQEAKRRGEA